MPASGGETGRRRVVETPSLKVYVALLSDFLASIAVCLCLVSFCKHFVCVWNGVQAPLFMVWVMSVSPARDQSDFLLGPLRGLALFVWSSPLDLAVSAVPG